jgi:hypothetical protein
MDQKPMDWHMHKALEAYSKSKTYSATDAMADQKEPDALQPPLTRGVDPEDIPWATLLGVLGAVFAIVFLLCAFVRVWWG